MKKHFLFLPCLVSLLSLVYTDQAVAKDKDHKPSMQSQRNPVADRSRLEKEVRHELVMLPYFTVFDNLGYRVNGNRGIDRSSYQTNLEIQRRTRREEY